MIKFTLENRMKRTLLDTLPDCFGDRLQDFIKNARVFDSSCSPEARVYYIEKDGGYFLKRSPLYSLKKEASLTSYFHKKGLAAEVIDYFSDSYDWLITSRVPGEDCTHGLYLSDPKRLCDTIAFELRRLHETDFSDCPVPDRMKDYLALAESNYKSGNYDKSHFPDSFGYASAESAYAVLSAGKDALKSDTLLHGDYCLPNIMLDNWNFSGFIDLGGAGVGDRHIDIFWGAWTLLFNLKTDAYRDRFFDAYGRDRIDTEIIKVIAAAEVFG